MNKSIYTGILLLVASISFAQQVIDNVGINTGNPDPSAQLDVNSTSRGVLIPRMGIAQRNNIATPATGLMVYQTDNNPGFYYYTGAQWVSLSGWNLTGNGGTNPANNFIGTTDDTAIELKVNNVRAGSISNSSFGLNTFLGYSSGRLTTPSAGINGNWNTGIGYNALTSNTTGHANVAVGIGTLRYNAGGLHNTALGSDALENNMNSNSNTAVGSQVLRNNMAGSFNTGMGFRSLFNNNGSYNTAIGYASLSNGANHSNVTTVGANIDITTDRSNVTAIGANIINNNIPTSNMVRIGSDQVTRTDVAGQVMVNAQSNAQSFTLPATRGSSGQILTSNGSGAANWVSPVQSGFVHYVGESFGGGVVFHVYKDASGVEHGLIVAREELGPIHWSNVTNGNVFSESSHNGLNNSNIIVSQGGHTSSAAKACLDLVSGGQSDWYLPAIDELLLLNQSRFNINETIAITAGNKISVEGFHWASTEYLVGGGNTGFGYALEGSFMSIGEKFRNYKVRAIRRF